MSYRKLSFQVCGSSYDTEDIDGDTFYNYTFKIALEQDAIIVGAGVLFDSLVRSGKLAVTGCTAPLEKFFAFDKLPPAGYILDSLVLAAGEYYLAVTATKVLPPVTIYYLTKDSE